MKKKLLFVVNVDWFFISHRFQIAKAAQNEGYEVHLACKITDNYEFLIENGIIVHPFDLDRKSINLFKFIKAYYKLLRIINTVNPSIVHLVTIKPILLGGFILKFKTNIPIVFSVSGLGFIFIQKGLLDTFRMKFIKKLYYFVFNRILTTVIFQNKDDASEFSSLPISKVLIIQGSGVNTSEFKYIPIPEGKSLVLMASRLLKDKGVYEYISAVRYLKDKYPDQYSKSRFVLLGDIDISNPSSMSRLDYYSLENENIVELWGHKTNMYDILPLATIVILPSYREGLPKILLEASACGRAIITTDVPGCRDAIIHNKTGILVPVKEYIPIAEGIVYLLNNKEILNQMSISARDFATQKFRVEEVVSTHLNIYNNYLN
jgi:glycosyltransferase involved in cell wall biosynthesis